MANEKTDSKQINLHEKLAISVTAIFYAWLHALSCHSPTLTRTDVLKEKLRQVGWDGKDESFDEFFFSKATSLRDNNGKIAMRLLPQHKQFDEAKFYEGLKKLQSDLGI